MGKAQQMAELRQAAESIREAVCRSAANVVFGEGNLDAPAMLVGEAPGRREEELRRPFVGPAGEFLEAELTLAGLDRKAMFITSVVKCRPVRAATNANRKPTPAEIAAWSGITLRQIEIIRPRVIVCLGAVAASVLIHNRFAMKTERGRWFEGPYGIPAMATYHPAYMRRFARSMDDERLRAFREDLREVAGATHDSPGQPLFT